MSHLSHFVISTHTSSHDASYHILSHVVTFTVQAFKKVAHGPEPDLPVFGEKYTHDQMFFIAFGQVSPPLLCGYTSARCTFALP